MNQQKKVIIIGGGFAGLNVAKNLGNSNLDVTLIDRNNYHTFQPLLYQVATGGLEPDSIAYPIRRILRKYKNVKFRMAEVKQINTEQSTISTSIGEMPYDYLVIATGSMNNYFNFEPIKEQLFSLKSVTDALNIRSYLMQNLEKVLTNINSTEKAEAINVAIVGGGPAGIELAGALAEMKKFVLPKDFPEIDFEQMNIYLFEASPKLLAAMSEESSASSLKYLQELGVNVHLNAMVQSYDDSKVVVKDVGEFPTNTVIWTAGVKGSPVDGLGSELIKPGNRIAVNEFNQVEGYSNIFAIGDVATKIDDENPKGLPMLAQVAIQGGERSAKNILALENGKPMKPFKYHNKGTMATIGRNKAVVDLPRYKFQGRFAWFVWMFIHLISLVGFRNKLVTFIGWAFNYFNYDRPLGLIIRKYQKESLPTKNN